MGAGLVTGLFSIPEGMAYASIAGFDPVAGLYAGSVPAIVGSLTARTVLMVTTSRRHPARRHDRDRGIPQPGSPVPSAIRRTRQGGHHPYGGADVRPVTMTGSLESVTGPH
ncbi:hypothetical protein HB370_21470 [Streptomyces sp. DSM 40868]|nr:hypothetical protein HB370_21470 [Streptomyces sp. DSM 40868]